MLCTPVSGCSSNAGGPTQHSVTQMLLDWSRGDREALDKLIPIVYDELRLRATDSQRMGWRLPTNAAV